MSQLVIDVTYLAHWQGNLTGITRMIKELAIRYCESDSTQFVIWDKSTARFYEIDIKEALKRHGKNIEKMYIKKSANAHLLKPVELSLKVSRRMMTYRVRGSSKLTNLINRAYVAGCKPLSINPSSTLLIPMGEWASAAYADKVIEMSKQGVKVVQVIHDMLPLVCPQYSGHSTDIMDKYCRRVVPVSRLVLAVSKNTKNDLRTWLKENGLTVPRIEIFRHGEDFTRSQSTKPLNKVFTSGGLRGGDFILCVGTVEARKNHMLLYYVYKLALEKNIKLPKLIIVGRPGWQTENIRDLISEDPTINKDIIFMGGVSDENLAWLYDNCMFTVFPSFYEGWGMPIAESIAHGKPCLASKTSSMTEIAGDKINYFSPASSDQCLEEIRTLLDATELKIAKSRISDYQPTSWDETVKRIDKYLEEVK